MEMFLGFVFICLVLAIIIANRGGKGNAALPIQQGTVKTHSDNKRKLDISQPVSEMIKLIESGEGFTLTSFSEYGYYMGSAYYLRFGDLSPQFVVCNEHKINYVSLDWMTKDEKAALVAAVYRYVADEENTLKQKERDRWCEMMGVLQNKEEK